MVRRGARRGRGLAAMPRKEKIALAVAAAGAVGLAVAAYFMWGNKTQSGKSFTFKQGRRYQLTLTSTNTDMSGLTVAGAQSTFDDIVPGTFKVVSVSAGASKVVEVLDTLKDAVVPNPNSGGSDITWTVTDMGASP